MIGEALMVIADALEVQLKVNENLFIMNGFSIALGLFSYMYFAHIINGVENTVKQLKKELEELKNEKESTGIDL